MANYRDSLEKARERRRAPDTLIKAAGALDSSQTVISNEDISESLRSDSAHIKGGEACSYARLCMQPVSSRLTRHSIAQGERVKAQLERGLTSKNCPYTLRYQGSIPMDVHIRATHDVDLLVIGTRWLRIDWTAPGAVGRYTRADHISMPSWLISLREKAIAILNSAYPAASVDTSGTKSIAISGGSLARKIDVVPSCWYDTNTYQASGSEKDRGIAIVDTSDLSMPTNFPFFVRHQIDEKNGLTQGGTKKIIRLLKSLKEDAGTPVPLSSFDIVSLVYHIPNAAITDHRIRPFALLDGALTALTTLTETGVVDILKTVDGTRLILDKPEKKAGLRTLLNALSILCDAISNEISPLGRVAADPRRAIREHLEY